MKYIRGLLLPLLLFSLVMGVAADSAKAQVTAVTYVDRADTIVISGTSANKQVAAYEIVTGANPDMLVSLVMHSYNQHAFSASIYKFYHRVGGSGVSTLKRSLSTLNIPFQTGEELAVTNLNIAFAANTTDTIIVQIDALTDSVAARPLEYDANGVQIGIKAGQMVFQTATGFPAAELIPTDFDPGPVDPDGYWIRFDTRPPLFTVNVTNAQDYKSSWGYYPVAGFDCSDAISPTPFALGDSIIVTADFTMYNGVAVTQDADSIKGSTIKIKNGNYGAFVSGSAIDVVMDWDPTAFLAADSHRVPMPLLTPSDTGKAVRLPTDFSTNYPLIVTAEDLAGNLGVDTFWFTPEVDTDKPHYKSINLSLLFDPKGDGVMSVGDTLYILVDMTNNPPFEVQEVQADLGNFLDFALDPLVVLEDISAPNNNTLWRAKVALDSVRNDRDIEADHAGMAADSIVMKSIGIYAWDDACNPETLRVHWTGAVDLDPPQFGLTTEYKVKNNADTNVCADFGDQVYVKVDIPEDPWIDSVFADLTNAGLNRTTTGALYDDATNGDAVAGDKVFTLDYTIGNKWQVLASDPLPAYAKDSNGDTPPANDADYSIWVYAVDGHGNRDSINLPLLDVDDDPATLDTKRPWQIPANALNAYALGGPKAGRILIDWHGDNSSADAQVFHIFDLTDGDWGDPATDEVGATNTDICFSDSMCWESEEYEDGEALVFGIRTEDDCGNWEFNNTALVSVIADAKAPSACVVYPTLPDNGTYGPGNPLNITAIVGPDVTGLDSAWIVYRLTDIGTGNPGPWETWRGTNYMTQQGVTLYETVDLGSDPMTEGEYELYILTKDMVGNVLTIDEAMEACDPLVFNWYPEAITAYFVDINGNISPNIPGCGYEVFRDEINEATVSVLDADPGEIYTVDAWVIYYWVVAEDTVRDSTRIEFADHVELPYTFEFSVTDWPKTMAGGYPTDLYIMITDTRNGLTDAEMAHLCVPDETAPELCMVYPENYQRVHIAHTEMDWVPVRAAILDNSPDPEYPIRYEFFYYLTDIADAVKIGETNIDTLGYAEVPWDNSELEEGWAWLFAVVHDDYDNVDTACAIKVYLDPAAPLMELTVDPLMWYCNSYQISTELNGGHVDLVANIAEGDSTVDIATVEFFVAQQDTNLNGAAPDLAKWYKKIGTGAPANNASIWTYNWDVSAWADSGYLDCWSTYKLRIKVTDISGNVYDDMDGDGQFDDYTFWDDPVAMTGPADLSKMLFTLHCGAPQVAIYEFSTDEYTWQTPSSILGGPDVVFAKRNDMLCVQSVALSDCQLECCVDIDHINYYFYSPVIGGYKLVATADDAETHYEACFDPFAMGLITLDDVRINGYHSYIKAELVDMMGATSNDIIDLWILDDIPGQAIFRNPTPDACVWNTVDLQLLAINGDTFKKVVYMISEDGDTWTELATVWAGDADSYFSAHWPTMTYDDGAYYLGFEVTDQNDNVTGVDGNQQIMVTVNNTLPTVTITAPEGSDTTFATAPTFIGEGEWFAASVSSTDIQWLQFQYKGITQSVSNFTNFDVPADMFPPWESYWVCYEDDSSPKLGGDEAALIGGASCDDGYYHFRAMAKNSCGRTAYSPWIMAYNDATAPYAELITVNGYDAEAQTPELPCFSVGEDVTFEVAAFDTLAASGVNSGVSTIKLYVSTSSSPESYNEVYSVAATDGITTFDWATSGLSAGDYYIIVKVYDAVGNVGSTVTRTICFEDACAPVALVAGFKHCKIFGLSEASATVQFQYSLDEGETWIAIGIADREDTRSLDVQTCDTCCGGRINYGAFAADWRPADGDYWVRLVARDSNGNKTNGAPLPITVAGCEAFATGNPTDFGDEHWIQKSWEFPDNCDLDGLAKFHSAYGMPWGISFEFNDLNKAYDIGIMAFQALPQQGDATMYAGKFDFDVLVDNGGRGWEEVYYFDAADDGSVGYSLSDHIDAYWLKEDLGSGGPVTGQDGMVTVDVPYEFTNDFSGHNQLLVLWESELAPPGVYQDVFIDPIGNPNGDKMYFIGNAGCGGDICGEDHRYATIKMYYDPEVDLPGNELKVMYYQNGDWYDDNIYFPSTVEGFNTTDHYVEFATTCLNGFYAVVRVQEITNCYPILREEIYPWCDTYTNGYPSFIYRVPEHFDNTIDWDYLMIKMDGVRVYTGDALDDGPSGSGKIAGQGTALGEAYGWDVDVDVDAARVLFQMVYHYYTDIEDDWYYDLPPLHCGQHILEVSVEDNQLREYCVTDTFMVDCTPPDVDFPNGYVSKNPTIKFDINDLESGVNWDAVYVDVFFVTKYDTTAGGPDYGSPKERVIFAQTFFPDQIKDYMVDDNTVEITTTYELDDERSILAVVYDGTRYGGDWYEGYYWDVDPGAYDQFDEFYYSDGGASDCAWNYANPHMQYLAVDYNAPDIEKVSLTNTCPLLFKITEDGSGLESVEIYEDGELLTEAETAGDVDAAGEYYLQESAGEGSVLYYCPTGGTNYKIILTDKVGNVGIYVSTGTVSTGTIGQAGVDAWNAPNPFDPSEENTQIMFDLPEAARVTIKVYDMGGELVRTLKSNAYYSTGSGYALWDGKTDNGTSVSTGVYLVHVEAVGEESGTSGSDVVKVAIVQK